VFHAPDLGVDLLSCTRLRPGVQPFPHFLADEIVDGWQRIFGERIDQE
jgi:adenosylhomocysteinase